MTLSPSAAPSIERFFTTIFGEAVDRRSVHVVTFGPEPGLGQAKWFGRRWHETVFNPGWNNYFTIAPLKPGMGRTLGAVERHVLIVADDVGTKVDPLTLAAAMGAAPTFKIETSPGNQTWGWKLAAAVDPSDADRVQLLAAIRDHMKHNGLTDPGTADPVRLIRLFVGTNTKEAYQNPFDGSFPSCGLVEWNPTGTVDLEALGERLLGPDFWTIARSGNFLSMTQVRDGSGTADFSDPLIKLALELGMNPRRGSGNGKIDANCPNMAAHSQRPESGFAFLGGGIVKCQHGECGHLTVKDMHGLMYAQYEADVASRKGVGLLVDDGTGHLADLFSGEYVPATGPAFIAREVFGTAEQVEAKSLGVPVEEVQERIQREAQELSERDRVHDAAKAATLDGALDAISERFALVESISGVVNSAPDNGAMFGVMSVHHFTTYHDGMMRIPTGRGSQTVGLGTYWLTHPRTPHYRQIGLWMPGAAPKGALNLYAGFPAHGERPTAKAVAGGTCAMALDFIGKVIADGDAGAENYILDWLAWVVQNPLLKPGVNLVLIGEQGTGKGTLGKMMLDVFGKRHSLHITQSEHLLGRFTGHLEGVVFALIDEAMFGKDKRTSGVYKAMTTENTLLVEHKGQTARTVTNHISMMILSNSVAAAPVEAGDRRSSVFEVSASRKQDNAFFDALWHEWDQKGGRSAFIDFLRARNVSKFDPWMPHATNAKAEMAEATGDPVTTFWLDTLATGNAPGGGMDPFTGATVDWEKGPITILDNDIRGAFDVWANNNRIGHRPTRIEVMRRIRQLCQSAAEGPRSRSVNNRARTTVFPVLDDCRDEAENALKGGAAKKKK